MKPKTILSLLLIISLLAGFFLLNGSAFADTNGDKLQQMLETLGAPNPLPMEYGDAWARLDRGQLVFGSPLLVPRNEWKKAPPDADGRDWQTANGIDLGHPGEEPRYLGFTAQGDVFSNDWFPIDAPDQIAPAKRNMIAEPWDSSKKLCSRNPKDISDYTWGVIKAALAEYHTKIGYNNPKDGFAYNPAFKGQFDINTIKRYFKVLSEPKPGVTGAVRHWHYRNGVPYYDTITVNWDVLPNFILEDIDPGTKLARPGETYTGKVKVKAVPMGDFLTDPQSKRLFDVLFGDSVHLNDRYSIPIGVTAGSSLTEMIVNRTVQPTDLPGVYTLVNIGEGEYEAEFKWQVPKDFADKEITIASEVNATENGLLPIGVYIDNREFVNTDNFKSITVPVDVKNLAVTNLEITPNPAQEDDSVTVSADLVNAWSGDITTKVRGLFEGGVSSEQEVTISAKGSIPFSFTVTAPEPGDYPVSIVANPDKDMPPDEATYDDNEAEGTLEVERVVPSGGGSGSLTFQAVSQDGKISRPAGTAKWTDTVTATLSPPAPAPPRGTLTEWHITSAKLTYPKKHPNFTFGNPLPPMGFVTVDMNPGGHTATATFREDWAMDGAKIYSPIQRKLVAVNPKDYQITATYTISYEYEYRVKHTSHYTDSEGNVHTNTWYETVHKTGTTFGSASGNLLVNGTGVNSRAE